MPDDIKSHVRTRYGAIASQRGRLSCGCQTSGCCGGADQKAPLVPDSLYAADQTLGVPAAVVSTSLGCGNPNAIAQLTPGEIVLDLGSGGGLDALIAAKKVAPNGRVFGLDMTPEMIELARRNQRQAGVDNAEFLFGEIEAIPLADASVDVIISNCVINLAPDKDVVLREAYRVLKPGGRLAISDTVFRGDTPVPVEMRQQLDAWAACVSGSLTEQDYLAKLKDAGFIDCSVDVTQVYGASVTCCEEWPAGLTLASAIISARKS